MPRPRYNRRMREALPARRCEVAVLVDEEVGELDGRGRFIVERRSVESFVLKALHASGRAVTVVPFDPAITPTIEALRRLKPRLVFNLTEWVGGNRRLDAAIAGMLEMMGLRYTGAGPEGMHLARDKALAKDIVADLGVEVASHVVVNGSVPSTAGCDFPLIVKPQFGDGSDGIAKAAVVRSENELLRRVAAIRRRSDEALLCEEFVEGRDLFVALLGNEPRVMPAMELVVRRRVAAAPRFSTYSVKNDDAYRRRWNIGYRKARLPQDVVEHIAESSRRIFQALKQRDYSRIDYRLTPDNRVVFLEVNANPDLDPDSFGRDVCFSGVPYRELIAGIMTAALER